MLAAVELGEAKNEIETGNSSKSLMDLMSRTRLACESRNRSEWHGRKARDVELPRAADEVSPNITEHLNLDIDLLPSKYPRGV